MVARKGLYRMDGSGEGEAPGSGFGVKVNEGRKCELCGCRCPILTFSPMRELICADCAGGLICVDRNCCPQDETEADD